MDIALRIYRGVRTGVALLALIATVAQTSGAAAEPVLDRALSGLRVVNRKACALVKIDFNFKIRYSSHFPIAYGDEVRIVVQPIDRSQAASLALLRREALRAPDAPAIGIKAIEFDTNAPGGPVLRVQFNEPVAFQVAPGSDFESLVIAVAGKTPSVACKPEFPATNVTGWTTSRVEPSRSVAPAVKSAPVVVRPLPGGTATEVQTRQAGAWMDEARAAMKKGDHSGAIRLLNNILALPSTEYTADAQELLGVAHQKNGQLADARAQFEAYLKRTPDGEGADRVRQRLAGIVTAEGGSSEKRRLSRDQTGRETDPGRPAISGSTWSMSGSLSEFYFRDDSYRTVRDPSLPPDINADKDAHRVHQNMLLSSFDLIAAWSNSSTKSKFRFSGTEEHSLNAIDPNNRDLLAVAALNLETTLKDLNLMTRIGRQTRNAGGVVGRFDGALASWQTSPFVRLNAVAGSPVERRKDAPFKDQRYFYGASVDFISTASGLETSLFALEQRDRNLLDRQAVGAEVRYVQPNKFVFANVDYDIHFATLNAAVLSGSWTLADKSTFYGALDYRKAPYLSAWTALQGQPFATLYDMLKAKTKAEIDQLALDRTATYKSATFGYSRPLTERVQLSLDATVANISGTIASDGVDASLAPGTDYYASAQLIGTNMFTTGDMYIGGVRYANRPDSNLYVLDLSSKYPWSSNLSVSPRVRLGYQTGVGTDLKEYSVLPSMLFNYAWTRDVSLELEAGTKWTVRDLAGVRETAHDLFFTVGVRYDFNADGRSNCAVPSPVCRK
jgi:Tetratricopeptide repeat